MARSPHPPRAQAAPSIDAEQASAALSAGKYREAAELFKVLLKKEPRPEWTQGLSDAYAGRAAQMAAKGMLQEALALWRTRAQVCGSPLLDGPYLDWLARTGSLDAALPDLLAAAHQGTPEQQAARQGRLGAAVLAAPAAALAQIPADSPLKRHLAAARQALAAVAAGDLPALDAALQGIPFRSPYRDLRPLLKAMALLRTDAAAAATLVERVPAGGAFESLAAPLRVAVQPAPQWLAAWHSLPPEGRDLVLDLKGCPPGQRPLVEALGGLCAEPPDKAPAGLFALLARSQNALPQGLARRWALRLWPHMDRSRPKDFAAAFGPLDDREALHAHALAAEIRQDPDETDYRWQRLADLLAQQPGQAQAAAMILRRLAQRPLSAGAADERVARWLEKSLVLDPDDRSAHLDLVRTRRLLADPKQARERLDQALQRWPDDATLLQQGVELALESGAFKKAATLAKQVQRLDPLNPRVPDLIGQAHLSHARKLIKTSKQAAAARELEQAGTWLRDPAGLARVRLLSALATPGGTGAVDAQTLAALGGPLLGDFCLAVECLRVNLPPPPRTPERAVTTPTPAEMLAFAQALNAEPAHDRAVMSASLRVMPQIELAAQSADFKEDQLLQVAEAFYRHGLAGAAGLITAAGRKRWPGNRALFVLDLAVQYTGRPWAMPLADMQRLEKTLQEAQAQGDARNVKRISALLSGEMPASAPGKRRRRRDRRPRMGPLDFFFADDEDDDDDLFGPDDNDLAAIPAEQFVAMLTDTVPPHIEREFRSQTKGLSPEEIKRQLLDFAAQMRDGGFPLPPPRKKRR